MADKAEKTYKALYRKCRPLKFEEVLGQTAVIKTLREQIKHKTFAHAYLFCGCHGTGKTSVAKIMSRAVNCGHCENGDPCGECEICRSIMNDSAMDVIEMDAASNSRVEEMRDLLDQVIYPPQVCEYKVYIIDEVHMLSTSAFNALLKTLEEPPDHVIFILATTEPQKIPATILSRVQRYDFGRIPTELIIERMEKTLTEMGISTEPEALRIVARSAEGAMRDAFSILDMCIAAAEGNRITAEAVRALLGTSEKSFLFRFFDALAARDRGGIIRMIDTLMRDGKEAQSFLKDMSAHCRCLLTVKSISDNACDVLGITPEEEGQYRQNAEGFSVSRLLYMLDLFMTGESTMRYSTAPRIALESVSLKACEHRELTDENNCADRIAELEQEMDTLRKQLQSGFRPIAQTPADKTIPAAVVRETPSPKTDEKKSASGDGSQKKNSAEIWKAVLDYLKINEAGVFCMMRDAFSVRLQDGKLLFEILPNKIGSKNFFETPKCKAAINSALKVVVGEEMPFQLITEPAAKPNPTVNTDKIEANLVETLGRDIVETI